MRIINLLLIISIVFTSCEPKDFSKHKFTSFDGVNIAYTDNGNGQAVLLVHGFIVDGNYNWGDSEL